MQQVPGVQLEISNDVEAPNVKAIRCGQSGSSYSLMVDLGNVQICHLSKLRKQDKQQEQGR